MPWRRQDVAPQMGVPLPAVRLLGNVIWFLLAGFWVFIGYAFAALLCFVYIVTIPLGVAALRIALFGIWPFGRAVIPQAQRGVGSTLGNVLWFVLGGWYLAVLHIVTGVLLCLTIIGLPLGLANFKLITVSIRPPDERSSLSTRPAAVATSLP